LIQNEEDQGKYPILSLAIYWVLGWKFSKTIGLSSKRNMKGYATCTRSDSKKSFIWNIAHMKGARNSTFKQKLYYSND